jgi:predicted peptidase
MPSSLHYLSVPNFQDENKFIRPERITAIGEVFEDGLVTVAIRIKFSGNIDAGTLLPSFFQVPGREVIRSYVNAVGNPGEAERKGRYLFLELLVNEGPDANKFRELTGNYRFSPDGCEWAIELPIVTAVKLVETVFNFDGRCIMPFNKVNDDQYIKTTDDFRQGSYVDHENNITINYNLYVPKGYEKKSSDIQKLPLVFFLHGAGESGYDNRSPVIAYRQAQEYITQAAQKENPCFLLIPQCPMTKERGEDPSRGFKSEFGWYTYIENEGEKYTYPSKTLHAAINMMLKEVIPAYDIDTSRIYVAGHSMGGGGAAAAMVYRPEIFAAALSFASAAFFPCETLERIKDKPIFFTIAEDETYDFIRKNMLLMVEKLEKLGVNVYRSIGPDAWDAALRGKAAEKQANNTITRAKASGASMIYAEYIKGSTMPNGHQMHRASFENTGIRHWLFEQSLKN